MYILACVLNCFSCVRLFVTPWSAACQAPLSMKLSGQEHWSRLPFPSPGDLPNLGFELSSLMSSVLAGRFFTTRATWEALNTSIYSYFKRYFYNYFSIFTTIMRKAYSILQLLYNKTNSIRISLFKQMLN